MNSEVADRQGQSIMDSESGHGQGSSLVPSWNRCFSLRSTWLVETEIHLLSKSNTL